MLHSKIYFTETGSLYTAALKTAYNQVENGQSILDSYRLQDELPPQEDASNKTANVNQQASKQKKGRKGTGKKCAPKPDNAYVRSLDSAELNGKEAPASDLMTDEGAFIKLYV
jgi:hypothetical protein